MNELFLPSLLLIFVVVVPIYCTIKCGMEIADLYQSNIDATEGFFFIKPRDNKEIEIAYKEFVEGFNDGYNARLKKQGDVPVDTTISVEGYGKTEPVSTTDDYFTKSNLRLIKAKY